jgi:hypothetical protein
MNTREPPIITRIPTSAFFIAPLLYGGVFGLHLLFPVFGERYLFNGLVFVFPCFLASNLSLAVMRLLAAPPRTWALGLSILINFIVSAFALWITWIMIHFPS